MKPLKPLPQYSVKLTAQELMALDGQCCHSTQCLINEIKYRTRIEGEFALMGVTSKMAEFMALGLRQAIQEKYLKYATGTSTTDCSICGEKAGYALYQSTGPGRIKGQPNRKKPLKLITYGVGNYSDYGQVRTCCEKCAEFMQPFMATIFCNIKAEVDAFVTGQPPRFVRQPDGYANYWCNNCGRLVKSVHQRDENPYNRDGCANCGTSSYNIVRKPRMILVPVIPPVIPFGTTEAVENKDINSNNEEPILA